MRIIRTLFWFFSVLALVLAGFLFFSQNLQSVTVEFAYWSTMKVPLALALLVSFSIGVLIAGLYFILDVLRLRSQLRRSKRMCDILNRELDALRNAPLYDELPSSNNTTSESFEQPLTHEGQPEASLNLPESKGID